MWSVREASLFDLFAEEVLTPLHLNTPGVFVHLYVTGHKGFPVSSVAEMYASVRSRKDIGRINMKANPWSSMLTCSTSTDFSDIDIESNIDVTPLVAIIADDNTQSSTPAAQISHPKEKSTHNLFKDVVAQFAQQDTEHTQHTQHSQVPVAIVPLRGHTPLDPKDPKGPNGEVPQMVPVTPIVQKFSVKFGRPDYGTLLHRSFDD